MTYSDIITEGATILVTGATGFIGAHCVGQLLSKNVKVRAVARSMKKYEKLKASVPSNKVHLLSPFLVSDITCHDKLVLCVRDCDGILHLASPYTYDVTDFVQELLKPAVLGTTAIMKAALTEPKIKRIIITSSFAAIFDATKGPQPCVSLSEKDFSPLTWEDGATTKDPAVAYRASKIVAERSAWDFMQKEKPPFDITILCPPMVFGPLYSTKLIDKLDDLNFSNKVIWNIAKSASSKNPIPPTKGPVWVDVRDLAFAQVQALIKPCASNSRYLVSAGDFDNQEIADILRNNLDDVEIRLKIPIGTPGHRISGTHFSTDSSKAIKELGITFRSFDECVLDLCNQLYLFC